jgi:perosamine synthetase
MNPSALGADQPAVEVDSPIVSMRPWFTEADAEAVADQVCSGFVGPGRKTREFADALAALAGRRFCELTTSGTIALSVAARAIGLQSGDEIIVPSYGVVSTINAFASFGFRPRLADIDRITGSLTAASVASRLTSRTRAVCYVNFSGCTGPDLAEIEQLCSARDIALIEDAACAVGQRFNGRAAGSFGTVSTFSFSVPKVITTGQGGAILTNAVPINNATIRFIDQGDTDWRRTNLNRDIGNNLRHNDILSAFGMAQLATLDERLSRRRTAYAAMREVLGDRLFAVPGNEAPLHNIVLAADPDGLITRLDAARVKAIRQYRTLSQHPPYRDLADADFVNADLWTEHAVYLPFGTGLSEGQALRVGEAVRASSVELLRFSTLARSNL